MTNRWMIALACAWINIFIFSIFRSAGVVYVELTDHFKCTYQQAAWSMSLAGSVASITGIFSGFLTHYFRLRGIILLGGLISSFSVMSTYYATSIEHVAIAIGLGQGLGIGLVTILLPVMLNAHFEDKKSIAFGISYAGSTLGAFVFPVLIQYLFDWTRFNNTMLLMGALMLNVVPGTLLLPLTSDKPNANELKLRRTSPEAGNASVAVTDEKRHPDQVQQEEEVKKSFLVQFVLNIYNDAHILINRHFVLCTMTYTCFILQFVAFIIILPDVARDQQINEINSKWLLSIFSVTDFVGRLLPGWLSYYNWISDRNIYILSATVLTISMSLLPVLHTWIHFVALTLVCGLMIGCQMVLSPVVLSDYVGRQHIAVAFGMSNFICGLVTLITRPLTIGLKDYYGSYSVLSYILATAGSLCIIFWLVELINTKFCRRNLQSSTNQL